MIFETNDENEMKINFLLPKRFYALSFCLCVMFDIFSTKQIQFSYTIQYNTIQYSLFLLPLLIRQNIDKYLYIKYENNRRFIKFIEHLNENYVLNKKEINCKQNNSFVKY